MNYNYLYNGFFTTLFVLLSGSLGAQSNLSSRRIDESKIIAKLNSFSQLDAVQNAIDSIDQLSLQTTFFETLKKETHGFVQMGYSYGLNTIFRDSSKTIGSIYTVSGSGNTQFFKLPVKISFNYNSLKVPLGTNNYFRISYDKEKLMRNKNQLLNQQLDQLKSVEKKLLDQKGDLSELQSYLEVYLVSLKEKYEQEIRSAATRELNKRKDKIEGQLDSLKQRVQDRLPDTLGPPFHFKDSLNIPDSLELQNRFNPKIERARLAKERVEGYYNKLLAIREKSEKLLNEIQQRKEQLTNARNSLKTKQFNIKDPSGVKKVDWMSAIKKVDIGLTYPSTTGLSNQSTAVKGIGSEWQFNQFYLAFSSGLTLNNVMLSTNQLDNELIYNQNVFNQFDFHRVAQNGILTTLKTGWGTPSSTHVFVGMNHLTNTRLPQTEQSVNAPSISLELDIRYVPTFMKGAVLDLVYGKTSINRARDTSDISMFNSLFSNYKSNSYLAKYTQTVAKLKSTFSFSFRQIDHGVNTNLYGLLQPGSRRLQFESKHNIRSFFKLATTYKLEESLGTANQIRLNTVGGNVSGSVTEYISYHVNAHYVNSQITSASQMKEGNNYLIGAGVQAYQTWGNKRGVLGITYTDFLLADSSQLTRFTQFGFQSSLESAKWMVSIGVDHFYQQSEIDPSRTTVCHVGVKIKEKKWVLDMVAKYAVGKPQSSLGGHVELKWEVLRFMELNMRAERLVLGNFYRNYYRSYYNQFPYLLSISTKFKL